MTSLSTNDPNSFSNSDEVICTHIDLDLEVDFKREIFHGKVNLSLSKVKDGIDHVVLDTRDLKVFKAYDKTTGQQLNWTLADPVESFGSKLDIQLPNSQAKDCIITVEYETSPNASALQWLRPSQTAGKRHPYLFSQCQAIHARSIIPCQDSPNVKAPYSARILAPAEITILMSAIRQDCIVCPQDDSKRESHFKQPIPMPSYLIAIVGGDIVSRDIGPRSKVWSEAEYVDRAAAEFSETEDMLKTAEDLLGPYVWGQYDLLVLPPSFPYGGMENPCLTFVTPTLLAGDKSLADVVAHEISHSWTGNLVSIQNFEHFWLNEGNTVFVERKIASRLKGGEKYRHFLASGGWNILSESVENLTAENHSSYTKLVPDMKGVDPDDIFSAVPYEKGHAFLFYLESLLGGPDVFDDFMKSYIEKFKNKSITTKVWKDFLMGYFSEQVAAGKLDGVDWEGWLYGDGMPPVKPTFDMSLVTCCKNLAEKWIGCAEDSLDQFNAGDIKDFRPQQTMTFLVCLLKHKEPRSHVKIKALNDVYSFDKVKNSEIRFRWLRVCIKARYTKIIPDALQFVTEQGRMKFVLPIYKDLCGWGDARGEALKNFKKLKDEMHQLTVQKVEKIFQLTE